MSENKYTVANLGTIGDNVSGTKISYDFGDSFGGGVLGLLCFILVVIATLTITGYVVQYTWNKTIPDIFGIKEITIYQAIGLFLLCGILFRR